MIGSVIIIHQAQYVLAPLSRKIMPGTLHCKLLNTGRIVFYLMTTFYNKFKGISTTAQFHRG